MSDRSFTDSTQEAKSDQYAGTAQSAPPSIHVKMPEKIGRYRLVEQIGEGGFGVVFLAVDESLDRRVAIKVSTRAPTKNNSGSCSWDLEGRMVAQLDHPNIVPVYDIGSTDDFPIYVVSKFIEGIDLRERLKRENTSRESSIDWTIEIAEALHHSHSHGLVHRDVKPSNILIDKTDRSWLTDFGLALRDEDIGLAPQKRVLVGTLSYMSPEQARGEGHLVDGRADIFSLGIVLYEMLVGVRPFQGKSRVQLLWNIVHQTPEPPREIDPEVPPELERICLKALAQRRSDRYANALEMAGDLRRFQEQGVPIGKSHGSSVDSADAMSKTVLLPSASLRQSRIIPKGLRSFDEHDQNFFLKLVPGPRDVDGVPEILLRLKQRIENRKLDDSFRVGMLYGSSGSGKSSLVRAGLVPLLNDSVEVVYVEANAKNTESRLLSSVASFVDDEAAKESLPAALAAIRKGAVKTKGVKIVLVLDQFEQWLHSHREMQGTELVRALRQCDGINLQCLVLIRDDFWMPATRFFHELEIRLVQGENCTAVDRFELRHAQFVLSEFGRAYGCLPEDPSEMTPEQKHFVSSIVSSIQEDGKVISIHLVVLAQMLKGREWNRQTLAEYDGNQGIDIKFLDATFCNSNALPHHRSMQNPARAVLAALLPEMDTNIKGQMKDVSHLRAVSKLSEHDFEELVAALDGELRLIAPTVNDDDSQRQQCYQLTHDFLVPPLRKWLTRNDRQTARGRTKLRLRELSQYWRGKQEKSFLPSTFEYLRIIALTNTADRNADEKKLVSAATRIHTTRWLVAATLALILGAGVWSVMQRAQRELTAQEAELGVPRLLAADAKHVLNAIDSLDSVREQADPILQSVVDDPNRSDDQKIPARLALVDSDPSHVQPLVEATKNASVEEILVICDRLKIQKDTAVELLWDIVGSESIDEISWLRAVIALAQLDADNEAWNEQASRLSRTIVNQVSPMVIEMAPHLSVLGPFLVEPTKSFFSAPHRDEVRVNAAFLLTKCLNASDPMLAEMLAAANPAQFELLIPIAAQQPKAIIPLLEKELLHRAEPQWPQNHSPKIALDQATEDAIKNTGGIAQDEFVMLQRVPLEQFDQLAKQLGQFGYRPECVRSYRSDNQDWITSILQRDDRAWEFTRHTGADNIAETDKRMRASGLLPMDLTTIALEDTQRTEVEYGLLWVEADDHVIDSKVYVGVTGDDHESKGWGAMVAGGYIPKTNMKLRDNDGNDRYGSIRWRTRIDPISKDSWNDQLYAHQTDLRNGWHRVDVRLNRGGVFDDVPGVSCSDVWYNGGPMESRTLMELPAKEHLTQSLLLAETGFRPVSISLVEDDGATVAASVWHRPFVTDFAKDEVASRQANAVIALLRLGTTENLWPLLDSKPDQRLRAFLMDRIASLGTNPQVLLQRMAVESNESCLFAIIAALSFYRVEQLTPDSLAQLKSETLRLGSEHPSAAIHSICGYLSGKWNWTSVSDQIAQASEPRNDSTNSPRWSTNKYGHTMVAISGPIELQVGSPGHERFRDHSKEAMVRTKIPRGFAISSAEVTVDQFLKFDSSASFASQHTRSGDCPMTSVSCAQAMTYCRWLSEQEGIEEDQMCYPPVSEILAGGDSLEGFDLPSDYLQRTGYRLPTEAEWEHACRALTTTSRHFGYSDDLLTKHAWTTESTTANSQVQFRPVKGLLPNGFGLFDTLGNVMEWTSRLQTSRQTSAQFVDDDGGGLQRISYKDHVLCGSAAFYVTNTMRSASREWAPDESHPYVGFRIARTLPTE